jgi:predicted AAA+ superfamily ATPase
LSSILGLPDISEGRRCIAAGPFPLLVDEWQEVPDVLGAVKRAVDEGADRGSFVLTGSSQADLSAAGWPATGRVIRVPMFGLSERELEGNCALSSYIDHLVTRDASLVGSVRDPMKLRRYLQTFAANTAGHDQYARSPPVPSTRH